MSYQPKPGEVVSEAKVRWTDGQGVPGIDFWTVVTDPRAPGRFVFWFDRSWERKTGNLDFGRGTK